MRVITILADTDTLMIGQMGSLYVAYIKMLLFYLNDEKKKNTKMNCKNVK